MRTIICLLLTTTTSLIAAELEGVKMPDSVSVGGKQLTLNGMGIRKYSIFKVKVYIAGLYTEKKSEDENEILKSTGHKQVRMEFLKPGPASGTREAWRDFLKQNWDGEWSTVSPTAEKYLALLTDVKSGDVMIHDFYPEKVVVFLGDKKLGEVPDKTFPPLLLSTWIGRKPSTEELKEGLLGKKP